MSNKKTVQCAFSHMDMWENLFSFTDYSKKPLKRKIKVYPISQWFSRSSKLLSNILELVISKIIFSEKSL